MNVDDSKVEVLREYHFEDFLLMESSDQPSNLSEAVGVGYVPALPIAGGRWFGLPTGFRTLRRVPAYLGLFRTANIAPPSSLASGDGSLEDFLISKQYRGAIWLRDIRIENSGCRDGRTSLSFVAGFSVGYTPLGRQFLPGVGAGHAEARTLDTGELVIAAWLKFKLGKLGDLSAAALTGYRAPSAWIGLQYRLGRLGVYDIRLAGSAIPSQVLYVDGNSYCQHEMLSAPKHSIEDFVSRGACRDAFEAFRSITVPKMARR